MTREDAKKYLEWIPHFDENKFIDEVFDDFESRTCENCKYFNLKDIDDNGFSDCLLGVETNYKHSVYLSFGCNKWESK